MSRSPSRSLARSSVSDDYRDAENQLFRLVKSGYSFSGHERNCAYMNLGEGRFANVSAATGFDFPDDGRAVALTDWDLDGDLDVWLANRTAPRVRFLRNDVQSDQHYVALRLEGRTSNRDAIGARVEVKLADADGKKLMRTVRAGDGYLSQSSKWLHFGLGRAGRVKRVAVRWPGGTLEEFTDLAVGRHYRIVEGSGIARAWKPESRHLALASSETTVPNISGTSRTFLAERMPLPALEYETTDRQSARLDSFKGAPLLANLWASWCQPCVQELAELARGEKALRDIGLEVLALSVESLPPASSAKSSVAVDTNRWLEDLGYPFAAGRATAEFVDQLQAVSDYLFKSHRPLPIPTSLLIDSSGRLAAIYKGPVRIDQLIADVELLSLEGGPESNAVLPFPGRWYKQPDKPRLLPLVAELVDQESWDAAVALASRYAVELRKDAGYPELLHRFGRRQLDRGQPRAAVDYFEQALSLKPDSPDGLYNLGIALTQLELLDDAVASYEEALKIDPAHAKTHNNLGNLLRATGNLSRANEHYRQALQQNPDLPEVRLNLGVVLLSLGRYDEAGTQFKALLELEPNNAQAHNNLGNVLAERHEWDEASVYYRRALQLDDNYAHAHNNLASILARQGKLAEATQHVRRAVTIDPEFADAHKNLGRLLQAQNESAKAVDALRNALQRKPDDPEAHGFLAIALLSHGDLASAMDHAREAVRLDPMDGRSCVRLGELLSQQSQRREAQDWFRQALELDSEDSLAHNRLGLSLASVGETQGAIHHLRETLRLQPDQIQCLTALAWLLATDQRVELRQPDDAVGLAERAAELTKHKSPQVLETLAASYSAANRFTDAVRTQQHAIQMAQNARATAERIAGMRSRLQEYREASLQTDEGR